MSTCAQCRSADMVRVAMTLNGGPVTFCHCRHCEHRMWTSAEDGNALPLPAVLEKVAS